MDDGIGRYLGWMAAFLLFVLLTMFFSASEQALRSVTESRLKRMSESGNQKAARLYQLREKQPGLAAKSGVIAVFCGAAAVCLSMVAYTPSLLRLLAGLEAAALLSPVLVFLCAAFLTVLFGWALPRRLAAARPESFVLFMAGLIRPLCLIFAPLTGLTGLMVQFLTRLMGIKADAGSEDVTEEEIRMLVDAGSEDGTIEFSEREMIKNVFEFDDRTVGEVMTHRTDISAVPKEGTLFDVLKIAREEGFSRIPVYDGDLDDIIGIVYAKDLLALAEDRESGKKTAGEYMRQVIYVPESTRCRMLFRQFKENKVHMAVVVDEYGGTAGIATMEDLLESIVGNIQDEYDQESEEVEMLDADTWSLDGGMAVQQVEALLGTELEADEDTDTLGGFITNTLGRIPEDGENPSLVIKNIEFTVLQAGDRRVIRVQAHRLPAPLTEAEA